MGCLPITSRYTDSNLPYLTESYDLGPSHALTPNLTEEERRQWFRTHWIPSLFSAYQRDINHLERVKMNDQRLEMMRSIRKKYKWSTIAGIFYDYAQLEERA